MGTGGSSRGEFPGAIPTPDPVSPPPHPTVTPNPQSRGIHLHLPRGAPVASTERCSSTFCLIAFILFSFNPPMMV